MAKKKLLNETQVRRFMGLAGISPVHEQKYKRDDKMEEDLDEAMYAEEEPAADDEGMGDEDMGDEDTKEISQDMVDDAAEALASLQGLVDALGGDAAGGEMDMGDEPEMDMDADMGGEDDMGDEMDMGDEDEEADEDAEEVIQEALKGVNLQLSENEVVQEVARRVAKRILKAKQAQARLDEALGNKPTRRTRRSTRRRR